jgi:hypothetical protein
VLNLPFFVFRRSPHPAVEMLANDVATPIKARRLSSILPRFKLQRLPEPRSIVAVICIPPIFSRNGYAVLILTDPSHSFECALFICDLPGGISDEEDKKKTLLKWARRGMTIAVADPISLPALHRQSPRALCTQLGAVLPLGPCPSFSMCSVKRCPRPSTNKQPCTVHLMKEVLLRRSTRSEIQTK